MVRDIVTDAEVLAQKSEDATEEDAAVIGDLLDTYAEHEAECVCMAANMIGEAKRIIVIATPEGPLVMVNPVITQTKQAWFAEEECISRPGARARGAKRFKRIRVTWLDADFAEHEGSFSDYEAQMIQHCVDHCNGVVI